MKKNIINMPQTSATPGTEDRRETASEEPQGHPASPTRSEWHSRWLAYLDDPDTRPVFVERWLQDELIDARSEQDERGVRGLARLFSAASLRVLRAEIAMILLGFPLPTHATHPPRSLRGWIAGYLNPPPTLEESRQRLRASMSERMKPSPLLDNGSWPKC